MMLLLAQDSIWLEIAREVPNLAVLTAIVVIFLRHMQKRDEMLRSIGQDCHEVQNRSIMAMERNTEQLGKTEKVLDEVKVMLVRQNGL